MAYSFKAQLDKGLEAERILDRHLTGRGFIVECASDEEQRMGIDRWITNMNGHRMSVEYKTDWKASETGNAFIETVSVDTKKKRGWAYTSQADWLIYYLPGDGTAIAVWMKTLREYLPDWEIRYRSVNCQNEGYKSAGLLVPLRGLKGIATMIFEVVNHGGTMIFAHTLPQVLDGTKTQTRRIVKPGDILTVIDGIPEVRRLASGKISYRAWGVGMSYAAQPGRGIEAVGSITVTDLRGPEDVRLITPEDVIAEGFTSRDEFLNLWKLLHGDEFHAWVITFTLTSRRV